VLKIALVSGGLGVGVLGGGGAVWGGGGLGGFRRNRRRGVFLRFGVGVTGGKSWGGGGSFVEGGGGSRKLNEGTEVTWRL